MPRASIINIQTTAETPHRSNATLFHEEPRMAKISKSEMARLQKILKTDAAIGKKFGITRQAVHQLRRKYGIESNTAKNVERNKKILSLNKGGKTGTQIAQKYGLSISQTYRIIGEQKRAKKKKRK